MCQIHDDLIGAFSLEDFSSQISSLDLPSETEFTVVDSSGEGWVLTTEFKVLSPLVFKKKWTKKEIITMFNESNAAAQLGVRYPASHLSWKRFDRILYELVGLIRSVKFPNEED